MLNRKIKDFFILALFGYLLCFCSYPIFAQDLSYKVPSPNPVKVKFDFELAEISLISEESETFEFNGILSLSWHDSSQAFNKSEYGAEEKIYRGAYQFSGDYPAWYPQVILANDAGTFEKRGTLIRVKADGTCTLIEAIYASAKAELALRRYPFDRQNLKAVFSLLGQERSEVLLETGKITTSKTRSHIPQWNFISVEAQDQRYNQGSDSSAILKFRIERQSFFVIRLVVLPLMLIVVLSWAVFWMDRSSLGDRISVSFVGILTAVAYQIVIAGIMPHISYFTLMNAFLNISFLTMCATVIINLVVGYYDKKGLILIGHKIDCRCRWIFPLIYFSTVTCLTLVTCLFL